MLFDGYMLGMGALHWEVGDAGGWGKALPWVLTQVTTGRIS